MSSPTDIFFKKTVSLRQGKHTLQFNVSQELFSSHEVESGTKFLLRTLAGAEIGRKVLDVGCGYGPLGLTLKRLDKRRVVHLVDRDALAVAYARQNAALNQLSGLEAYGSLGYDGVVDRDFDLIVSNVPGKMSAEAIGHFLLDGRFHLTPTGFMAIVVINPLRETVSQILDSAPDVTLLLEKPSVRYTVFHFRFEEGERPSPPTTASLLDIYHRDTMTVTAAKLTFPMQTARGLPEFDELGHHTKLMLKAMSSQKDGTDNRVLIFNPGQGHVAVAAWHLYRPEQIVLADRDLLSLQFTRHNLRQNGCPDERIIVRHQVGIEVEETADLIIGPLRGTEGVKGAEWIVGQAVEMLGENGRILTAANSHLITQLTLRLPKQIKLIERKKRKGQSLIVLANLL